jgi:hypothetical protein
MGINIYTLYNEGTFPRPLVVELRCDWPEHQGQREIAAYHESSHPVAMAKAMANGWLEKHTETVRMFVCPSCSGKKVMTAGGVMPDPDQISRTGAAQLQHQRAQMGWDPDRRPEIISPAWEAKKAERAAEAARNTKQADKPVVWTYTMLQTYRDVCGHQANERFVARKIPFFETPEILWGRKVHDALELRMLPGRKQLPEDMRQWEPLCAGFDKYQGFAEQKLAVNKNWEPCDYYGKDVYGRGRADWTIIGGKTAYFLDWKTGNERDDDDFELRVQAALLAFKYPEIEIFKGQFMWLKTGKPGKLRDLSDIDRTCDEIDELYRQIMHDRDFDTWAKTKSGLCGWCPVQDCEHYYVSPKRAAAGGT